jgi:8-oxo-dGTP pyrophosphatase MutT (NUDIX family)
MARRSGPFRADRPTVPELAAGAALRQRDGGALLLLHEASEDRWCFPKGHVEPGESLEAAARREVTEETGVSAFDLLDELVEVRYRFYRPRDDRNVFKTVVYFLAETTERTTRTEATFDRAEWVGPARAGELLKFPADRDVLLALGKLWTVP